MDYKRLTKNIDGINKVDASILKNIDGKDLVILEYSGIIQKVIDRLAELEDKLENGTLIVVENELVKEAHKKTIEKTLQELYGEFSRYKCYEYASEYLYEYAKKHGVRLK